MNLSFLATPLLLGASLFVTGAAFADDQTVNVYSYREPTLIEPLLQKFEAETGITPIVLFADKGLIERAEAEGENSPVDLILTTDIGNLAAAVTAGITQKITSPLVTARVPEAYRDPDGGWVAVSLRARVFYASRERVSEDALTYDDIAKPEWKGRLCTRSGQHVYNIGMFASYIADHGRDAARDWIAGIRDNLIASPSGSDRAQIKSIYSGACDLAIGNTYYMGLMENNNDEPEQKDWASAVRIIFPSADAEGTHVNVSGAILAKHAPNKDNAVKLIEFLVSDEGQALYAEGNYEYPVVASVPPSHTVAAWGELVRDDTPLAVIASHRADASALVDELQFDGGPQN